MLDKRVTYCYNTKVGRFVYTTKRPRYSMEATAPHNRKGSIGHGLRAVPYLTICR